MPSGDSWENAGDAAQRRDTRLVVILGRCARGKDDSHGASQVKRSLANISIAASCSQWLSPMVADVSWSAVV